MLLDIVFFFLEKPEVWIFKPERDFEGDFKEIITRNYLKPFHEPNGNIGNLWFRSSGLVDK